MLAGSQLVDALKGIDPNAVNGRFARRVPLAQLFGIKGQVQPGVVAQFVTPNLLLTSTRAYRYNQDGVETLYLGEGEDVAGAEVKQEPGLSGFARKSRPPDSIFHVEVKLWAVLDLVNRNAQSVLKTNLDELTAPWRLKSPNAPTQILGASAFKTGRFEAIRYPSAPMHRAGEKGASLVIFRNALHSRSTVEIYDPTGFWRDKWM